MAAIKKSRIINCVTLEDCDVLTVLESVESVERCRRWEEGSATGGVRWVTEHWGQPRPGLTPEILWQHGNMASQTTPHQTTPHLTPQHFTMFQCFPSYQIIFLHKINIHIGEDWGPSRGPNCKKCQVQMSQQSHCEAMQQFTLEIFMDINGVHLHFWPNSIPIL